MQENTAPTRVVIDFLPVSAAWKQKFRLLKQAGAPKLTNLKSLSFKERFTINFNIIAFLFGPFYYLAKGMWKKALSIFAACAAAVMVIGFALDIAGLSKVSDALGYGVSAIFALRANIDYYKKMVLCENGWW